MESYIETRVISLNSLYANIKKNGTFNSDVVFTFKNILKDENDITRSTIQIINALIPVSYYCINYTNDNLNMYYSNIDPENNYSLPIIRGNYNSSNLITEMKAKLGSIGFNFNITISRITGKLTFYANAFFGLVGNAFGVVLGLGAGITYQATYAVNSLGNYNITCPYPLNLLGIKKIKVISNALSTYSLDSYGTGNNNIINTVPITAPPFGLIVFNQITNPLILRPKIINEIDIQLVDENNEFVNFNNIHWSMTLQLDITRVRPALAETPTTINEILLRQIDKDIQSLDTDVKTQGNSAEDGNQGSDDNQNTLAEPDQEIDPTNTLDFLQYSGGI